MILTPADLQETIGSQNLDAELISGIGETPTVEMAAVALGVVPDQILKTLVFFISGVPHAVIGHGLAPISSRALAGAFGVGKRQVKLAKAEDVLRITGYPVGGVPPFGHLQRLDTLMDEGILAWQIVYGGGGDHRTMMRVSVRSLQSETNAKIVNLEPIK